MAYLCRAWEDSLDFNTPGMLKRITKHRMESFALVVFYVGHLLQLALVTTSPSLPYWTNARKVLSMQQRYSCFIRLPLGGAT